MEVIKHGERLDNIKESVSKNVACCRYAMKNSCQVRLLGKGQITSGYVSRVTWDDMEDLITIKTGDTHKNFYGSEIATVRLIE